MAKRPKIIDVIKELLGGLPFRIVYEPSTIPSHKDKARGMSTVISLKTKKTVMVIEGTKISLFNDPEPRKSGSKEYSRVEPAEEFFIDHPESIDRIRKHLLSCHRTG
jgi:hypothetical protein